MSSVSFHDGQDCRSLKDAVRKLHDLGALPPSGTAQISARYYVRPDEQVVGMIVVHGKANDANVGLKLPNFRCFSAETTDRTPIPSDILALDDAVVDANGVVTLQRGGQLHNVQFVPDAPLMYEYSERDEAIVRCVIRVLGIENRCYRAVDDEALPGLVALDYAKIAHERLRNLKVLLPMIALHFPTLGQSDIKVALKRAGFRFLRSKRH